MTHDILHMTHEFFFSLSVRFFLFWYPCFITHTLRDSVSPVSGISLYRYVSDTRESPPCLLCQSSHSQMIMSVRTVPHQISCLDPHIDERIKRVLRFEFKRRYYLFSGPKGFARGCSTNSIMIDSLTE